MLTLAELLHPITPDRFMADYHDRKPLHIPAGERPAKADIFDWDRLNGLLGQSAIWTAANLKLVRDGTPIPPDQYCIRTRTPTGEVLRPAPARVDVFLSTGASLIADDIQTLTPELATLADMLARTFGASVGANAYASFGGVQAFGTHFDLHDVFAVHISGEKTWQLYESRADTPVTMPGDGSDPRPYYQQTRGPLMRSVRMRPGDVLYLPRGWYHDALADGPVDGGNASLHVTYSVAALYGRILFGLLESVAMQDPAFRAYFPPAHADGGAALQRHLADLGQRLSALAASPGLRDTVAGKQAELAPRLPAYGLPVRKPLTLLRPAGPPPPASGPLAEALHWAFSQPTFALEDLCAEFETVDETALRAAVAAAEAGGTLKRV